ncbi:hypothetical protein VNO77_31972 [Canavalia gladiata]|uniref:Uncharacterized protein n=1 Tax=Canavalia gladiata TaxID=3824 RepID=A0AAN9Q7Z7_CANGL
MYLYTERSFYIQIYNTSRNQVFSLILQDEKQRELGQDSGSASATQITLPVPNQYLPRMFLSKISRKIGPLLLIIRLELTVKPLMSFDSHEWTETSRKECMFS